MKAPDIIKQTKQLIAIPSTSDNPAALKQAVEFVAEIVARVGNVTIERFEQNGKPSFLAYRGSARPEKFDILLNAHLDVVPAKAAQFNAVEKDGKLYGRGALDMKGTALVLADVFCEVVNEVPYALGLQVVSDEEIGGYDGAVAQIKDGVAADFVVIGEYSNDPGTIYNAARGLCWAEIAFKGKTAHGGHLWHGSNAIVKAGDFASAVLKRFPTPDRETWTTTASIASVGTPNDTFNKVPDSAVMKVDFRFTPDEPIFKTRESLEAFIHSIDPEAELIATPVYEPAVFVDELNPYVQGLSAALRAATGHKPTFRSRPAGSDGRHYPTSHVIEFGLNGGGSHSDHEYVELGSFAEYQQIMRTFLRTPIPAQLETAGQQDEPLAHTLLRKLVAQKTTVDDQGARNRAVAYAAHFLEERGMSVQQFEHEGYASLVATTQPGSKHPVVLLSAHLDVVPAPEELFTLQEKDGKFIGRGAMDMKFAVASYLALVDKLQGELHNYDFGIMLTTDEEVGGANGTHWLLQEQGYRAEVVLIPDGAENWQLETFAKGVQWVKLEAAGKAAHASRPWKGDSAIKRLLQALHDIQGLVPANPQPEDTILSVGTIEGGTTANQIPVAASAMLDIRTGSVADHEQLFPRILAVCENHGVAATLLVSDPPCVNDPEEPYLKPLLGIIDTVIGKPHGTSYSYGATDGRFFSAAGIPCAIISPEAGGLHTDDEWLSITGFGQFCEVLEHYVRQVASVELNPSHSSAAVPKQTAYKNAPANDTIKA
ncbi:MAG TPA: M20/M25/M40 family metallo-hydrolase [Candidatus Saccharimonadales bacterium]|nr:M20/M25/M40 family metallo-hydrolase [Candidatus Saccharimonadales bacterium]